MNTGQRERPPEQSLKSKKLFLLNAAYIAVLCGVVYIVFRLLPYIMPFAIGFAAARAVIPAANAVSRRTRIPAKLACILCMTMFLVVILLLATFVLILLADGLSELIKELPDVLSGLPDIIMSLYEKLMKFAEGISPELAIRIADTAASLTENAAEIPQQFILDILKYIYAVLTGVPSVMISVGACIVSAYLFVTDMPSITGILRRLFPALFTERNAAAIRDTGRSVCRMLVAYLKLMLLTAVELLIGLWILKVPFPFTLAIIISIIDILPVLGVGTVLIPWGLICILAGDPGRGFGLLILYLIITVIRSAAEPKVVGSHIQLHPMITLLCVFLGLRLGGILGMFCLPIAAIAAARYFNFNADNAQDRLQP